MRCLKLAGSLSAAVAPLAMLLLGAAGAGAASAPEKFNIKLNAGEAYLISDAGAAEVVYTRGPDCFSVQSRPNGDLLVLGACRSEGTITTRHNGNPAVYHVTVNALANPNNPLAPGKSPHALNDDGGPVEAPSKPAPGGSGSDATGGAAPTGSATERGGLHMETVAPSSPQPAPVAVLPSQMVPPVPPPAPAQTQAAPLGKYKTDPPAVLRHHEGMVRGPFPIPPGVLTLMNGTAQIYDFPAQISRVAVSNSKIADIQVVNPHQLMLVAHNPGFATLAVWDDVGQWEQHQVRVERHSHQQVMLNVTVAEVDRTRIEQEGIDIGVTLKQLGVSFVSLPGGVASPYSTSLGFLGSPASNIQGFAPPGGVPFPLALSNNITYALAAQNSAVATNSFFQFLEEHQLARVLAQPQLLANSGETAKFLSGGEIPIVIAQALNTSIVFKQFGTSVKFLPTVIGDREIELEVKPEVSKPDYALGVQLFGFTVPAFLTQRAETDVRMKENQTLIIAGLIQNDTTSQVRKVPYLGDMPYLGSLFRNTQYNHVKTELVMAVTPQIVGGIPSGGEIALPTERGPLSPQETQTTPTRTPDASRQRLY